MCVLCPPDREISLIKLIKPHSALKHYASRSHWTKWKRKLSSWQVCKQNNSPKSLPWLRVYEWYQGSLQSLHSVSLCQGKAAAKKSLLLCSLEHCKAAAQRFDQDNVDVSKRRFSWEFKTKSKREQIRTFWDLMGKSHSQFLETHSFSFQSIHTRAWKKKKPKPPFGSLQNLGYNIQKEHLHPMVLSIILHLSTVSTHSLLSLQGVFGGNSVTRCLFQCKNNTKKHFFKEQHGKAIRPQSTLLHKHCSASPSARDAVCESCSQTRLLMTSCGSTTCWLCSGWFS